MKNLHEFLREHTVYEEGKLKIIKDWTNLNREGTFLGNLGTQGYLQCNIQKITYSVHKLVWMYHNSKLIKGIIAHIDGNKLNNYIENLMDIPRGKHRHLSKASGRKSKLGIQGVYKSSYNRYSAYIQVNKNRIFLGSYLTAKEAEDAYIEAKEESIKIALEKGTK